MSKQFATMINCSSKSWIFQKVLKVTVTQLFVFLKISESICYVVSCHAILLDMREVISTTLPSDTEGIRATKSNVLRHIIQNFYYVLLFIFQIIGMSICVLFMSEFISFLWQTSTHSRYTNFRCFSNFLGVIISGCSVVFRVYYHLCLWNLVYFMFILITF